MGEAPLETEKLQLRRLLVQYGLVWAIVGVLMVASSPAASQPVADLLRKLGLSGYPQGERPPPFTARTYLGRQVSLSSLKGKVVILNFWASWCYECRREMPAFEKLHRQFAGRGLAVIGVNVREADSAIRRYAEELRLTFPLLTDPDGRITESYGVIGLATTFIIGRDGGAVGLAIGPRAWDGLQARQLIEALLAEPSAGSGAQ